ncbi:MAG: Fmu (Sun) domain-containing protein [Chitinophagaceae bacterium]
MHRYSYINSVKEIISSYNGIIPFASWLKKYFAALKKYGSKDRKHITQLCYSWFRLGKSFDQQPFEERLLIAQFLTSTSSNVFLQQLKPEWNQKIESPLSEKLSFLNASEEWSHIFPWLHEVTKNIDEKTFVESFLSQPDLFLRIRPGYHSSVRSKLDEADVEYSFIKEDCCQLPVSFKVQDYFESDREVVVQDFNSQQVLNAYKELGQNKDIISAWDCCAASGGKSLLLYDQFKNIKLTVSDIRKSILHNLQARFKRAGIKEFQSYILDLSKKDVLPPGKFDLVICDAPCSGSGTWSRTPEQIYFFKEEKILHYQQLQQKIIINASKGVNKGGYFLYITCSVFTKENEDVVSFIKDQTSLNLVNMNYYKGYDKKADTLFAVLFTF